MKASFVFKQLTFASFAAALSVFTQKGHLDEARLMNIEPVEKPNNKIAESAELPGNDPVNTKISKTGNDDADENDAIENDGITNDASKSERKLERNGHHQKVKSENLITLRKTLADKIKFKILKKIEHLKLEKMLKKIAKIKMLLDRSGQSILNPEDSKNFLSKDKIIDMMTAAKTKTAPELTQKEEKKEKIQKFVKKIIHEIKEEVKKPTFKANNLNNSDVSEMHKLLTLILRRVVDLKKNKKF